MLDLDSTVFERYGRQEGSLRGYNPRKHGRPSHHATYLEQALTRLNDQPMGPERDRKEIAIRWRLADAAMVVNGYAATEYENHLTRRYELAQRLGTPRRSFIHSSGCRYNPPFDYS